MPANHSRKKVLRSILFHRGFIIAAIVLSIYTLAGFFLLPYVIQRSVPELLEKNLNCRASVGEVRFNPYLFKLTVDDFRMTEPGGTPLVALSHLLVDFETSSLYHWAWTFQRVIVSGSRLNLTMGKDGVLNMAKLVPPGETGSGEEKRESQPVRLLLQDIQIVDGEIDFTDERPSKPASITLRPLNLDLKDISTLAEKKGSYSLTAKMPEGTEIRWKGEINLAPVQSKGLVEISNVSVETIWQFFRDSLRISPPAGRFDVRAQYGFDLAGDASKLLLDKADVLLSGLTVAREGDDTPAVALEKLRLRGLRFDLDTMQLNLSHVGLEGGHANVVRGRDGGINLADLGPTPEPTPVAVEEKSTVPEQKEPGFRFLVERIDVKNFSTSFTDHTVQPDAPVVRLDSIHAALAGVDGKSPMDFSAGFQIRDGGRVTANGVIHPAGPVVQAELELDGLSIPAFQSYINPHANIQVHSGSMSSRGRLRFQGGGGEPMLSFLGQMALGEFWFSRQDDHDEQHGWRKLTVSKINFKLSPDALRIGDVQFLGASGSMVIDEAGNVNFARMAKVATDENRPAPPIVEKPETGSGFPVRIDRVKIMDSKLAFADLGLQPQFATKIHRLNGSVTGISTSLDALARLELSGDVDEYGEVKIEGEIAIADPKHFTDITMAFRNIEMNNMTPYSGRFAGRRIDSGRLSLDLEYKIENSRLLGENQIVLDSLILGDRVESPNAVSLPLDLAIAILADADGRIDIGLPVQGNLEDPEFSYGHLIWQALVNVIKKIVTSPFRALSGLLGDGMENPDSVVFSPGDDGVSPPEREKLEKIASVLVQRPQLALVVQGKYSPEKDGEALRKRRFRQRLAVAAGMAPAPGEDPGPVDFTGRDTRKAMEKIFLERFTGDDLDALVRLVEKQVEEELQGDAESGAAMENPDTRLARELFNRLVETEPLPEDELTALAVSRADAVANTISNAGDLPPERLGRKDPEAVPAGEAIAVKLLLEAMK